MPVSVQSWRRRLGSTDFAVGLLLPAAWNGAIRGRHGRRNLVRHFIVSLDDWQRICSEALKLRVIQVSGGVGESLCVLVVVLDHLANVFTIEFAAPKRGEMIPDLRVLRIEILRHR